MLAGAAATELPQVSLEDALALVLVACDDPHYPRAATRWPGRLYIESPGIDLSRARVA